MIILFSAAFGAVWGGLVARRRGGNRLDIAQYAGGFGILFAILGLAVTIYIARTMA